MPMEIHPDTPGEGLLLSEKFKGMDTEGMFANLRRSGAPYGIDFGSLKVLSNSRKALEAGEFARDHGKFEEFHELIFHAYFTETRDIGEVELLVELAQKAGLDTDELRAALEDGRYMPRLESTLEMAHHYGINSTPTFVINNKYALVGAQPLDRMRAALRQIAAEEQAE